ncbi:SHC-transforming protein 1-like isoform X2 [Symsagittifera roscoffensis]|uniref:SHC-transforming protein 1-like isoform X2 n=1 Tax=Symsagittifera roscoffensis TaxID=84072 RepID=UPI00307CB679
MSPFPATNGIHVGGNVNLNMQQQPHQLSSQASGWNQMSGSLSAKPTTGWLHPDESLIGDGVRFHVNYVGCVAIKESMRNLDFDKRTLLAREAICQVVHFTHYKHLQNWTPNEQLQKSGDGETSEFIGYVAKDADNSRACHVVEVPALAPDVIATIGQAFELRYKQHIQGNPGSGLLNNMPPNTNGVLRTGPQMITNDSKWGDETASQYSQNSNCINQLVDRRLSKDPSMLSNHRQSMISQRNSQYMMQNVQPPGPRQGFEDNFVPQNPAPYINMNQNSHPQNGIGFNQAMSVNTDLSSNSGNPNGSVNFRNSFTPTNGLDQIMTSPNQQLNQQKQMQTFYQSSPPVPMPRRNAPGVTFSDNSQAASNLAVIMNQSHHVQHPAPGTNITDPGNVPRIPDRKSPKPGDGKLVPSPHANLNMPDLLSNQQTSTVANKAGNRSSNASSADENLIAIPQTESVLPLNSQVWFHGAISRTESERRLRKDGDFLVREKQAAATDTKQYVLSGYQGGVVKHLLLVDPHGRVRTKNNIFESVGHLITHHMRNNIPIISSDSQVRLGNPVKKPSPPRPGMHATEI